MNIRLRQCLYGGMMLGSLLAADGRGQEVIDSVDVGGWNVAGLTYNSRAGVVYGGCFYGHNFFAISCSTDKIVSQIPVVPRDIAYAPLVNKAYCGFSDSILVVDGSTHTRIGAIPTLNAGFFAMDTLTNRLYFTCYYDDKVGVLDCVSDTVLTYISIPGEPVHLTINTRRRKLYCQNNYNMTVSVIDMNANQVIRNVYTGSWYMSECYSEAVDKYYCGFANGPSGVTVIDGATDSVIKLIPLPQGYATEAMVSIESESLVMVAAYSGGSDSVFTVDARTDSIRSAVWVRRPFALAYSQKANVVYCTNGGNSNCLSVITADGSRVLSYVHVSSAPQDLLVVPSCEKLYVGHGGRTNMLYIVRDRVGIAEPTRPHEIQTATPTATIIRNGILPHEGPEPASLMDVCGRRVSDVAFGNNDLSTLSPGVYVLLAGRNAAPRKVVKLK